MKREAPVPEHIAQGLCVPLLEYTLCIELPLGQRRCSKYRSLLQNQRSSTKKQSFP